MSLTNYPKGYKPYEYRVRPVVVSFSILWFKFKDRERYVAEYFWDRHINFCHWTKIGTYFSPASARKACHDFASEHLDEYKEEVSYRAKVCDCNSRIEILGKLP